MSSYDVVYRATVYADEDMTTVLTPASGAPHSDAFKVATATGVSGFKPYMSQPTGRRGEIKPAQRSTDTGSLSFNLLDKRVSDGNLERWVTAFMGDSEGEPQLGGKKVLIEESLDGGSTWNDFFTGRLQSPSLRSRTRIRLSVRDLAQDLQDRIFGGRPHSAVSYAFNGPLLPVGLQQSYGDIDPVSEVPATVDSQVNQTRLRVKEEDIPDDLESRLIVTKALREAALSPRSTTDSSGGGSPFDFDFDMDFNLVMVTNVRVNVTIKSGTRAGESGAFYLIGGFAEGTLGTIFGAMSTVETEEGHQRVRSVAVAETDPNDPEHMDPLPDGEDVEFYMQGHGKATEGSPIFINDVHPVTLLKDILRGRFGVLDVDGSPITDVDFSDPENLENDESVGTFRAIIEEPRKRWKFIQEAILKPYGLGLYFDPSGTLIIKDMRPPEAGIVAGLDTLGTDSVDVSDSIEWEHDRGGAITRLDFTAYLDEVKNQNEIKKDSETYPDVSPALVEIHEVPILVVDIGDPSLGTEALDVNALGYRASSTESHSATSELRNRLLGISDHWRQPFSRGPEFYTVPFRRTPEVDSLDLGDFAILDVDEFPDPKTNKRGGARLAQVVSIEPRGPRKVIRFLDHASAQANSAPSLNAPTAAQTDGGGYAITQGVTVGGGQATIVEYAVTDTSVTTRPVMQSSLWRRGAHTKTSGDVTFGPVPGQKRVWTRARDLGNDLLPSPWAFPPDPGYVDTANIAGISNLSLDENTGTRAKWTWTVGDTDLRVLVTVTDATNDVEFDQRTLPAGTTGFEVIGTTAGDDYKIEIQQVDELGGKGNKATGTWTAGVTPEDAPRPVGLELIDPSGKERTTNLGQAMWVFPADAAIPLILQVAHDDGSGNPDESTISEYKIPLGAEHFLWDSEGFSIFETAHFRILHRQGGWNDSEPTAWHRSLIDFLPTEVGPRPKEPLASADLHIDPETGVVTLEIDGETGLKSAKWWASKTSFADATSGSSTLVALDSEGDATVSPVMTLDHGETAYVAVHFFRVESPSSVTVPVATLKVSETFMRPGVTDYVIEIVDADTVKLTPVDPDGNDTYKIEFWERGYDEDFVATPDQSTTAVNSGQEVTYTIQRLEKHGLHVRYRVTNEVTGVVVKEDTILFDPDDLATHTGHSLSIDGGDVYLHHHLDSDGNSVRYASAVGSEPSRSTVQSGAIATGRTGKTLIHSGLGQGQTLEVGVLGYTNNDGTGNESTEVWRGSITRTDVGGDAAGAEPLVTIEENRPVRSPTRVAFNITFDSGPESPGGGLRYKWRVRNGVTPRDRSFDHDGDGDDDWFIIFSEPITLHRAIDVNRPQPGRAAMLEVVVEDTAVGSSGGHPTTTDYHDLPPQNRAGRPPDDVAAHGPGDGDPTAPVGPPGGGGDGGGGLGTPVMHLPINLRDDLGVELMYDPKQSTMGPALQYPGGARVEDREPQEAGANVTENRTSADTSAVDGKAASQTRQDSDKGASADDDLTGMDSSGYVDRAGSKVTDLEYPSGSQASTLEPAEANAEQNPPQISIKSVSVVDDGSDDTYSGTWDHSGKIDSNFDVTCKCYREGTHVGTTTVTATNDSFNLTDVGAGDGVSDEHSIIFELKNSSGDVVQTSSVNNFISQV